MTRQVRRTGLVAVTLAAAMSCKSGDENTKPAAAPRQSPPASDAAAAGSPPLDAAARATLAPPKRPCYGRATCRRHCDGGHAPSCVRLGEYLEAGWGGPEDEAGANKLWRAACKKGDGDACLLAGTLRAGSSRIERKGVDNEALRTRGMKLYEAACVVGNGERCELLARLIAKKNPIRPGERFLRMVRLGCKHGHPESCDWLVHGDRNDDKQRTTLRRTIETQRRQLCKAGDPRRCRDLAITSARTPEGVRYLTRAIELWTAQCKAGYKDACDYAEHARTADPRPASLALFEKLFGSNGPAVPAAFDKLRPWMTKAQLDKHGLDPARKNRHRYTVPGMPRVTLNVEFARGYQRVSELNVMVKGLDMVAHLRALWGVPVMSPTREHTCWFDRKQRLRVCANQWLIKISAMSTIDELLGLPPDPHGVGRAIRLHTKKLAALLGAFPLDRHDAATKSFHTILKVFIPGSICQLEAFADEISFVFDKHNRAHRMLVQTDCRDRPGLRAWVLKRFAQRVAQLKKTYPNQVFTWTGPADELILAVGSRPPLLKPDK